MRRVVTLAAIGLVSSLVLAACTSISLAPPGAFEVGGGTSVQLDRAWNDASAIWPDRPKKMRMLTLDGPALNRLYLTEGLVDGDVMARSPRRESRTPVYATAMTVNEQVEFVGQSLSALGYERVETSRIRPAEIAGLRAARFDIAASSPGGLLISGVGQVLRRDDKLYVAVYLAPTEHYFEASRSSALHAMDTLAF
ncbi:MAG: hypothetical protein FD125_322 [bacterium]|nr:MAG: hypothetical protein FD125_322 [bacterium]